MNRNNGGTLGKSGWRRQRDAQRQGNFACGRPGELPSGPTAWELLLRELGLDEAMAAGLCRERPLGVKGAQLKSWVKRNCSRHYVPEEIVLALGIEIGISEDAWEGHGSGMRGHAGIARARRGEE